MALGCFSSASIHYEMGGNRLATFSHNKSNGLFPNRRTVKIARESLSRALFNEPQLLMRFRAVQCKRINEIDFRTAPCTINQIGFLCRLAPTSKKWKQYCQVYNNLQWHSIINYGLFIIVRSYFKQFCVSNNFKKIFRNVIWNFFNYYK